MACGKLKRMNRDGEAGGEATPMRVFLSYARIDGGALFAIRTAIPCSIRCAGNPDSSNCNGTWVSNGRTLLAG
jgi:hypothetical protein